MNCEERMKRLKKTDCTIARWLVWDNFERMERCAN